MASRIIDISVPVEDGMPIWPGSVGVKLTWTQRLEDGDFSNNSRLDCDVHVGTHIDAPLHFIEGGASAAAAPLDALVGPAYVADLPGLAIVAAHELDQLAVPPNTERLLLRTRNSQLWADGVQQFRTDYTALTEDAARWVVNRGVRLIGVDYLSAQRYQDGPEVHQILLEAGVVIVEGLNLSHVRPGTYELLCLPMRLVGAEGAPARAVLRPMEDGNRS